MHRARGTAPGTGRRGQHPPQLEPPGAWGRGGVVDLGLGAHVPGEQAGLVGGLVSAGVPRGARSVGGHRHQRDVAVERLQDGRVQVRGGRPGRGHHRDRSFRGLGQAEGEEPGGPLVDAHVEPEQPDLVGLQQLVRQRCAPRSRRQHDLLHPGPEQLGDHQLSAARGVTHGRPSLAPGSSAARCRVASNRACQNAVVSASAACVAQSIEGRYGGTHRQAPVDGDQWIVDQVVGQQSYGVQPARVRQVGQRRRQGHPGSDPHRGLQGARHDHRQADLGGDRQAGPDAAEWLHLENGDVGRAPAGDQVGVAGAPDRLVGRDRYIHAGPGQGDPERAELVDRPARLLGVLQSVAGEPPERVGRLLHVPGTVGVDPDTAVRTERVPHGRDPVEVVAQCLTGFGDLDLDGSAPGVAHQHGGLLGPDRGDCRVDLDLVPDGRRPPLLGGLVSGPEPRHDLVAVVVEEGTPLRPTGRPRARPCRTGW